MQNVTLKKLLAAPLVGMIATTAVAQPDAGEQVQTDTQDVITLPGVTAQLTLDYTTNYFFRGIEQTDSDQGLVFQPGASFSIPVVDEYRATIGTWNSIHTDAPTSTANPGNWFEQDLYANISGPIAGDFSGLVGMTYYTFPSVAANNDIIEVNLGVSFDDSELLGDLAFSPYIAAAIEIHNNAAPDENSYLEVGGEFSLDPLTEGTGLEAWDWVVPVRVGLSLDDYYVDASGADSFFGFAEVGLVGTIPLEELIGTSEYLGAWDLSAGVRVVFMNGDINGVISDNSSDVQFIGTVGISRDY